ncbi:MAG: hypothetical protein F4X63_07380 [Nitrospira sp. SB0662_bin_26]|nr:hypothetical protein [Nitrospira sp. SB0662_bin_26]
MKVVIEKLDLLDILDPRIHKVLTYGLEGDKDAIQFLEEKGIISIEMIDSETMNILINRNELKKLEDEECSSN